MGRLGLVGLGVLIGAGAGLIAGFALALAWFELFRLPALDNDPKGLSTVMIIVAPSIAVGATAAPMWLLRRRAAGARIGGPAAILAVPALAAVLIAVALVG